MTSPRFKFGLDRVRDVRAHDEDRAKEAFAASLAQRARGAALLAAAGQQVDAARQAQREAATSASGQDLWSMQLWLERVERSRHDAEAELARHDAELVAKRGALTEASRRRQALDKLKERRAAEHRLDADRRESAVLDEIALGQHMRKVAS